MAPAVPSPRRPRRAARVASALCCLAAVAGLSGCGLTPRAAPLAIEMNRDEPEGVAEGLVAPLTPAVAATVNRPADRGFPDALLTAPAIDPARLGVGDELEILVWETDGGGLFVGGGPTAPAGGPARLSQVRIDASGDVYLPFAGRVRADGLTLGALRDRLRAALSQVADTPEVDVRLDRARSRTVTVQGVVRNPGAYTLERDFTRLAAVLALAGGSPASPEQVEVAVRRGALTGAETLQDFYRDPGLDIALRPGDVVVLTPIDERFVALGASSAQAEVVFPTRRLSLLSALGAVAGLRDFDADPEGVFVLRHEDRAVADALLPGPPPVQPLSDSTRPVVYQADLTTPEGLLAARAFMMRDGDTMIASNAPLTELRKVLQTFTAVLTPVQQTTTLAP